MAEPRVLFIDDETNVLKAVQRLFRREQFAVDIAATPDEALALVAQHEYAVVVCDQRMPLMEGTVLLAQIREQAPATIRMTLTGYADKDAAIDAINRGSVSRFLTKPWQEDELRHEIRRAVEEFLTREEVSRLQELTARQNCELQSLNSTLELRVEERTAEVTRLNRSLKGSFMSSIAVMAQLGEMHSPVVGSHSHRVAVLSKDLATAMRLPDDEVSTIYSAALLHDIGKIGLAPALLQKDPRSLSENEREAVRRHVLEGERIVAFVPALRQASRLVRAHHERWNGSGYPDRLQGPKISLGARIIAVADHYDNSLNHRVHYEKSTPAKAFDSVAKYAGSWFDPEIVSVLARLVHPGGEYSSEAATVEVGLRDLHEGMQLAAALTTVRGVMLLPASAVLSRLMIDRVLMFSQSDPIDGPILIYRRTESESSSTLEDTQIVDLAAVATT